MFKIASLLLAPLHPYLEGLRIALYAGCLLAAFGFGFALEHRLSSAALSKLSAEWSNEQAKQAATALAIQQQRDAAANAALQAAMADAAKTESTLHAMEKANAQLVASNTAISRANGQLRDAAAAYASGGAGSTAPACAGVAGRARVLGQLLGQSVELLAGCGQLASQGAAVATAVGIDAERLADQLRALIGYEQAVDKPGGP